MKLVIYVATVLIAGILPLFRVPGATAAKWHSSYHPVKRFNGAPLTTVPMEPREKEFYGDFPGEATFCRLEGHPGENVFLRYLEKPTRLLHPAETCYRAQGFKVIEAENVQQSIPEISSAPIVWSRCTAEKSGHTTRVLQAVISLSTRKSYSDVATWYWLTTFSSEDPGPWLAVVWSGPN